MNKNKKIYLSSPHMGGKEKNYVEQAFETNWVAPLGPNVDGFEGDLKEYLKQEKLVAAVNSGTSAIHLALIMAGVKRGDSVICQSMTFSASANPILYQGATPIFIDSEIDTWNLSPTFLEEAILSEIAKGRRPKAIIAVHLYGMPCKVDEVRAIANTYDILLIEDSAEALGSHYKERKCGTFGDFGILSFNGNKIITTSGGGALVTSTKEAKKKALFLATQARDNAAHYQHSEIGYNYRMSNICAGIGRGQMEVLDEHVGKRRAMHDFYKTIFKNISDVMIFEEPSAAYYSNYWLSSILLKNYDQREALRLHLEKTNIESRPLWKPMHLQPIFEEYPYYGEKVSENLFIRGLCLPSGSNLTDVDRGRIEEGINSFFK
jgi:dTDP-4-amino-4,6-dideoxygalactose transaminase